MRPLAVRPSPLGSGLALLAGISTTAQGLHDADGGLPGGGGPTAAMVQPKVATNSWGETYDLIDGWKANAWQGSFPVANQTLAGSDGTAPSACRGLPSRAATGSALSVSAGATAPLRGTRKSPSSAPTLLATAACCGRVT